MIEREHIVRKTLRLLLILACSFGNTFAETPTLLNDSLIRYHLWQDRISVLEDQTARLTFQEVMARTDFQPNEVAIITNKNKASAYWLRFKLKVDHKVTKRFLLEFLDHKSDYIEVFLPIPTDTNDYSHHYFSDRVSFHNRPVKHKNYVLPIPDYAPGTYTCFVRIQSDEEVALLGMINAYDQFLEYATNEYLLLSVFYGILITTASCALFLFFSVKDKSYLFYSLYTLSLGVFFVARDGLGFQYVWSFFPEFNRVVRPLAVISFIGFYLLYVRHYLKSDLLLPLANKKWARMIFYVVLGCIALEGLLNFFTESLKLFWLPMGYLFTITLLHLIRDYKSNQFRLLLISNSFILAGLIIYYLRENGLLPYGWITYYSLNIGTAAEMLMLTLAMSMRIKDLVKEKQAIQESINKELEEKVQERTLELDTFVYKASHDIKGPIRAITSLSQLGLKEAVDNASREYFMNIFKTSSKMEKLLNDLLRISQVKEAQLVKRDILIEEIIRQVQENLMAIEGYKEVKIKPDIARKVIRADETLLYSVVQNLVENAIKYRDPNKAEKHLYIESFTNDHNQAVLVFEDNGIGIEPQFIDKVFDMFYRANTSQQGTGLGLYLVKLSVEKMDGTIHIESEPGKGTTVLVTLDQGKERVIERDR